MPLNIVPVGHNKQKESKGKVDKVDQTASIIIIN